MSKVVSKGSMLDSILERPSLEGTQAEGNLNGTGRLSVPGCQNGFCTLNGGAEADVGPSSERSLFSLPSVQQSPFTEVRYWRPPQIEGTAQQKTSSCDGQVVWHFDLMTVF